MAKRPAEVPLAREEPTKLPCFGSGGSNPFSGVGLQKGGPALSNPFKDFSLLASAPGGTGGGTGFGGGFGAASVAASMGGSNGFPASGFGAAAAPAAGGNSFSAGFGGGGGCGFGSSSFPASTPTAPAAAGGAAKNPFSSISLFSAPPKEGGFFTAAAAGLTSSSSSAPIDVASAKKEDLTGRKLGGSQESKDGPSQDTAASAEGAASTGEEAPALDDKGETGEEHEEVVFKGECKLWKLTRGGEDAAKGAEAPAAGGASADSKETPPAGPTPAADAEAAGEAAKAWRWQERGSGVLHINRHKTTEAGRLVMRMRGVGKLLLNTPVIPTAKYESLGQRSVKFVGVDVDAIGVEGASTLCAYRMSMQCGEQQAEILGVLRDKFKVAHAGAP